MLFRFYPVFIFIFDWSFRIACHVFGSKQASSPTLNCDCCTESKQKSKNGTQQKLPGRRWCYKKPLYLQYGHRIGHSTAEPKHPGIRKNISGGGGVIMFHPRKKRPPIQLQPQTRDTKINPGREKPPKMFEAFSPRGSAPCPRGPSKPSPRGFLSTPPAR